MTQIPYLSEKNLDDLKITTADVISSIESAIVLADSGSAWSAPKAVIMPSKDNRYMMAALAAMDSPSLLTVKTVVLNPTNPDKGLPQINGLVTVLNSETGLPVAIIDGNWITAVRTAGLSAVAAKHMANKTSESIGFIGCGVQAHSHLNAYAQMFPLKHINIFGRGQLNKDKLTQRANELGLSVDSTDTGQQAIEDVDLIVSSITVTGGADPFLDASRLKKGAFVSVTDLAVPWHRDSFASLDCVVIDDVEQEASLPNKLCDPAVISGDLSGLVLKKFKARTATSERTAFVFRGHALGDLALSALALNKHQAQHPI